MHLSRLNITIVIENAKANQRLGGIILQIVTLQAKAQKGLLRGGGNWVPRGGGL